MQPTCRRSARTGGDVAGRGRATRRLLETRSKRSAAILPNTVTWSVSAPAEIDAAGRGVGDALGAVERLDRGGVDDGVLHCAIGRVAARERARDAGRSSSEVERRAVDDLEGSPGWVGSPAASSARPGTRVQWRKVNRRSALPPPAGTTHAAARDQKPVEGDAASAPPAHARSTRQAQMREALRPPRAVRSPRRGAIVDGERLLVAAVVDDLDDAARAGSASRADWIVGWSTLGPQQGWAASAPRTGARAYSPPPISALNPGGRSTGPRRARVGAGRCGRARSRSPDRRWSPSGGGPVRPGCRSGSRLCGD